METDRKKILVLYASYGDGHIQVSQALKERFESAGCEVKLSDLFAEAYPVLNELTKFMYIKSYTLFPKLYGWSYYSTRHMRDDTPFAHWFHSWGTKKLKELLRGFQPDAVINTFPMLAMPELRKKTGVSIPIFTVITDFTLHQRWVHPLIDKYYVATEDLRDSLIAAGISSEHIAVSGIPLKQSFQPLERTPALYEKYGLDPLRKTVLIMAGSYGVLTGLKDICRAVAALPNTQLMIVCGKNKSLYHTMQETVKSLANAVVFGYCQQMHELMSLADVMVTKPGGVTLAESIQCALPLVLLRPVPGQERDNAEYFAEKGAAIISYSEEQAVSGVRNFLSDTPQRAKALQALHSLQKKQVAETIVADILEHIRPGPVLQGPAAKRRRVTSGKNA